MITINFQRLKLCDYCKRLLESFHAHYEGSKKAKSIIFHGKYMDGSQCTARDDEHGKHFCVQRLILYLADLEKVQEEWK